MSKLEDLAPDFYAKRPVTWKFRYVYEAARLGASLARRFPNQRLDQVANAAVDEMLFSDYGAPLGSQALKVLEEERASKP